MEKLGYTTPAHYDISELKQELLEGKLMKRTPVIKRKKRVNTESVMPPISPEEKIEAVAKAKAEREAASALKKLKAEEARNAKKQAAKEAKASKK